MLHGRASDLHEDSVDVETHAVHVDQPGKKEGRPSDPKVRPGIPDDGAEKRHVVTARSSLALFGGQVHPERVGSDGLADAETVLDVQVRVGALCQIERRRRERDGGDGCGGGPDGVEIKPDAGLVLGLLSQLVHERHVAGRGEDVKPGGRIHTRIKLLGWERVTRVPLWWDWVGLKERKEGGELGAWGRVPLEAGKGMSERGGIVYLESRLGNGDQEPCFVREVVERRLGEVALVDVDGSQDGRGRTGCCSPKGLDDRVCGGDVVGVGHQVEDAERGRGLDEGGE